MGNTIPSYSEWCDNLTDNDLEELELTGSDLEVAYAEYAVIESSNVDKYTPYKKVKHMEIYEVEL